MIENCFRAFEAMLSDPSLFINGKIGILVHKDGKFDRDYVANDMFTSYANYVEQLPDMLNKHYGFKIIGLENYNDTIIERCSWLSEIWNEPCITAHGYLGFSKGSSFDWHTDDCNVYLYVISGSKLVYIENDGCYPLTNGHGMFITKGVKHRIVNETDNVAISFGHL